MMGKAYRKYDDFNTNEIDISLLPVGIYYLKIKNKEGEKWMEKIVKH